MARKKSSVAGVFITSTGWTGSALPYTKGTQDLHADIAATQVKHWSPDKIKRMARRGYFDNLTARALALAAVELEEGTDEDSLR